MNARRTLAGLLLCVALAGCGGGKGKDDGPPGPGSTVLLRNDSWEPGETFVAMTTLNATDEVCVVLGPLLDDYKVEKVLVLFGGGTTTHTVTLTIYNDGGTAPGSSLYSNDFALTGSNLALAEIDLSSAGVIVPAGKVWVSIRLQHAGTPSASHDFSGSASGGRNYLDLTPGTWADAATLGIQGDFVIRALVAIQ